MNLLDAFSLASSALSILASGYTLYLAQKTRRTTTTRSDVRQLDVVRAPRRAPVPPRVRPRPSDGHKPPRET